jgi:hypothetical protein
VGQAARQGDVVEDDPASWAAAQVSGISKAIKRDAVSGAVGSPVICGAVDDLLGEDGWDPPRDWGRFWSASRPVPALGAPPRRAFGLRGLA